MLLANRVGALGLLDRHDEAIGAAGQALIVAERAGHPGWPCSAARSPTSISKQVSGTTPRRTRAGPRRGLGAGSSLAHGLIALIAGYRDEGDVAVQHLAALSEQGSRAAATASTAITCTWRRRVAEERAGRLGSAVAVLAACLARAPPCALPARHLLLPPLVGSRSPSATRTPPPRPRGRAADEAEREPLPVKGAVADHCRGPAERRPGAGCSAPPPTTRRRAGHCGARRP